LVITHTLDILETQESNPDLGKVRIPALNILIFVPILFKILISIGVNLQIQTQLQHTMIYFRNQSRSVFCGSRKQKLMQKNILFKLPFYDAQ
jgi:hypothetical protein